MRLGQYDVLVRTAAFEIEIFGVGRQKPAVNFFESPGNQWIRFNTPDRRHGVGINNTRLVAKQKMIGPLKLKKRSKRRIEPLKVLENSQGLQVHP
jgi:hypothetical protein